MEFTTLCYLERDDHYLMLHRTKKEHDFNKDMWIGVGGHFEENEKVLIADESKPFCVCPLINKDTDKLLPAMCYCSEGFAERMFSVVCEHQVEAVVISSVQRGDERCIYRIELNRQK